MESNGRASDLLLFSKGTEHTNINPKCSKIRHWASHPEKLKNDTIYLKKKQ